ncbi:MAG TPA: PAS domain S-box protein [Acidobacteriota bacterium]|nr:PAS domain S-box protein [Acidobacteriota bacterium]
MKRNGCRISEKKLVKASLGLLTLLCLHAFSQAVPNRIDQAWRWSHFAMQGGLPAERIKALAEADDGTLWALSEEGLAYHDDFRWRLVEELQWDPAQTPSLASAPGEGVLLTLEGRLHLINRDGVENLDVSFQGRPLRILSAAAMESNRILLAARTGFYRLGDDRRVQPTEGLPSEDVHVRFVKRTSSGRLWASASNGLFQLQGREWRRVIGHPVCAVSDDLAGDKTLALGCKLERLWMWTRMDSSPRLVDTGGRRTVAAAVSPDGDVLAAYSDGRIEVFQGESWTPVENVPTELVNPAFLKFQRNGDLWVGSEAGLSLCRLSSRRWVNWAESRTSLEQQVNELLVDREENIWVGTSGGLLVRWADGTSEVIKSAAGTDLGNVTALAQDSQGGVWVGSGSSFTGAFRWKQGQWRHFGPTQGLEAPRVHRIRPDGRGGLWFLGLGVVDGIGDPGAFHLRDGQFTRWDTDRGLIDDRVYDFAEGPDGAYWFATRGGLSRYSQGAWRHWNRGRGLRRDRVYSLAVTPQGKVWFAHKLSGLGYLDAQGQPHYFGTQDGLVDERVWEVAPAPDGSMWIATEDGISRLKDGRFSNFGKLQGLENPRVWPLLPLSGRILVGTRSGVAELSLQEAASPAPLVILREPVLSPNQFFFSWQALAYRGEIPAAAVLTRYRLDDGAWSDWSTSREVRFNGLKSGAHRFQVQSRSLFGNLSEPSRASVEFDVSPPIYRHPLVLLLAAVWIFSLAGLALHHHRLVRRREEHFRSLIENARESITVLDADGNIHYQSPAVERLLQRSSEEMEGTSYYDWIHPDDVAQVRTRLAPAWQTLSSQHQFSARFRHQDGSWRILEASVHSVEFEDGRSHLVVNALDVTHRKEAESALRDSEQRFRRLFNSALTGNFVADGQGVLMACNPAFARLFGFSSVERAGRANLFQLLEDSRHKNDILEALEEEGQIQGRTIRMLHQDGHVLDVLTNAFAVRSEDGRLEEIQGHLLDDSERKQIELQLLQAQKMESIGALAGGIAHDFNNLISVINGYSDMVLTELDRDTPFREFVEQIKKAGDRASLLTGQILAFSRRQVLQGRTIELNESLEEIGGLIRRLIGEDIELSTEFSDRTGQIKIDPGQLEQVVMNLVVNARDAMPGGGRLSIRSSALSLDRDQSEGMGIEPGEYVQLRVSDTGIGMDEATQKRIFEPFFTTKEMDKGTGLGLSTIYAIVRQNGGAVSVESQVGKGTAFTVYLPQAAEVRGEQRNAAPGADVEGLDQPAGRPITDLHPAQNGTLSNRGRKTPTVLLVEDDNAVRELSGQILLTGGYRVLTATDGHHAIKVAQEFQEPIDLLVTDVIMPGMNGYELGRRMSRRRMGVKVLYLSGYTDDVLDQLDLHKSGVNFMQKPFTPDALLQKVAKVLGRPPVGRPTAS